MTKEVKDASIMFVAAKYDKPIIISKEIIRQIPNKIVLYSSVQFLEQLEQIKKQLETEGKTVLMTRSRNFLYDGMITQEGQLLGCNAETFCKENIMLNEEFEAFLYVGDGVFHPKALLVRNRKDIYCYNPKTLELKKLEKELYDEIQRKTKGNTLKFLTSKNIGIIVTTKRGQCSKHRAEILRKNIFKKWPDKQVFMLICNELNFSELENFNFIELYINTACSRIGHDDTIRSPKPIINIEGVEALIDIKE